MVIIMETRKISVLSEFSAAHRLMSHNGKCRGIHGHNYEVVLTIEAKINEDGMILDFAHLKRVLKSIIDEYDHSIMLYREDPFLTHLKAFLHENKNEQNLWNLKVLGSHPTVEFLSEEFAMLAYKYIEEGTLGTLKLESIMVDVSESNTTWASYSKEFTEDDD